MKKPSEAGNTPAHGSYVQRVREDTHRYAQELLSENERLRVLIAALESDRSRLEERMKSTEDVVRELDLLRGMVASLEREKLRLHDQLLSVRNELDGYQREHTKLQRQLADIEKESRRFSEQFVEVEAQNSNLANLYVASYRLHGTLERKEVLAAVQEIVANLIGSEEMAVYEMDQGGTALELVASFGIDPKDHGRVPIGAGRIGRVAQTGDPDVGRKGEGDRPQEANLTACVPFKLDGRVTGALALFRLLPQKAGFEAVDHELFDLLATHAAMALYCTSLHARLAGPPA
jgi:GAF domain